MRIAMGLLGTVVLLGGVGWAGIVLLAFGMSDAPSQESPGFDLLMGGGAAIVGGILLAGAIAG